MGIIQSKYSSKKLLNAANLESFDSLYDKSTEGLKVILDADDNGEIPMHEAAQAYKKIITEFENVMKAVPESVPKKQRDNVEKRIRLLERTIINTKLRMETLKETLAPEKENGNGSTGIQAKNKGVVATNKEEHEVVGTIVDKEKTKVTFGDVGGNEAPKRALRDCIIRPCKYPALYTGPRTPAKAILFFGSPGNGKTMIAKACATEAGCTFFNISAATIMSKWQGESEKKVEALFTVARKMQPSIIFIDEADSILCEYDGNDNGSSRRVTTQFQIQMDGVLSDDSDRVFVVAATNYPYNLPDAVLRRFTRRIFIESPTAEAREAHIKYYFKNEKLELSDTSMEQIVAATAEYSYSDLTALCQHAANIPANELCDENEDAPNLKAEDLRSVQYKDFNAALKVIKPSPTNKNCQKMAQFIELCAQQKL